LNQGEKPFSEGTYVFRVLMSFKFQTLQHCSCGCTHCSNIRTIHKWRSWSAECQL